jgi:hypothetical protein
MLLRLPSYPRRRHDDAVAATRRHIPTLRWNTEVLWWLVGWFVRAGSCGTTVLIVTRPTAAFEDDDSAATADALVVRGLIGRSYLLFSHA